MDNIRRQYRKTEDNDFIIAEIKISEDGELISDNKINFAKKHSMLLKMFLKIVKVNLVRGILC